MIPTTKTIKLSDLKPNTNNPRFIRDEKFQKLVKSIQEFPQMLELRPIVVDADYTILGGNMRYMACKDLRIKEVPVIM
jgi:ParB-like chromosome segregation protein Spo0J